MANPRLSAPFLVFLLIAILGLVLPDLASATISPGTDPVSDQTQASSLTKREPHPSPKGSKQSVPVTNQEKSVYIITLKDGTTDEEFQAYKQYLISRGIEIKYEYNIIKGFAVSTKPSEIQPLENDPLVKSIEKDQEVHTLPNSDL
ncbi:hypothetical protein PCANC_15845 [Puccinia coronata f. sp. avenae]|uniref:Inhibitor I9 domain-containing protein n=1 Tax=Puccinia coronata f. sp. avenae TaxID=200324 RepID=A0A2N5SQP9_9BASI|nr:hypothetical protein PCANC_15845 [Puccinia coronata f. sp. avenae]